MITWLLIVYGLCFSTRQDTAHQTDELKSAGCVEEFAEMVSSRATLEKRHQYRPCLETLLEGAVPVVSKLDRGQSQVEVINRLAVLQAKGILIRTLDGLINTRGLGGLASLVIGLLKGVAEVERSLIQQRTQGVGGTPQEDGWKPWRKYQRPQRRKNVLRLRCEG